MSNWEGFRELVLIKKEQVCDDIKSFYFKAKHGLKLKKYIAGQFIPIKIKTNDENMKEVIRTYSLSDIPNDEVYRISVKRIEGGVMSSYLHDNLKEGDVIEAMPPCGSFIINEDLSNDTPIVLLSGGIGVTPVLSMLLQNANKRDIHFIQAVQNSSIHPFANDIASVCKENNLKNTIFYSNPLDKDEQGKDYDIKGYVTKEWLEENVPLNADFYFCGPPIFMESLEKNLLELGVSENRINYERF